MLIRAGAIIKPPPAPMQQDPAGLYYWATSMLQRLGRASGNEEFYMELLKLVVKITKARQAAFLTKNGANGRLRLLASLERFHLQLNDVRREKKVKSPIEGYAQAPLLPWKGEQVVSSPGEPGQKSREPHTPDSTHTSMSA